jgi:hypothetical protein
MKSFAKRTLVTRFGIAAITMLVLAIIGVLLVLFTGGYTEEKGQTYVLAKRIRLTISDFLGRSRSADHGIISTRQRLKELAQMVDVFFAEHRAFTNGERFQIHGEISSRYLLNALRGTNSSTSIVSRGFEADCITTNGLIIDSWNKPIHFQIQTHREGVRLRIWSDGPDGRNDNGAKDDIQIITEPIEFR